MAMAKPVIATRVGGIPEALEDHETGLLVQAHDSNALAQAIQSLVENPSLCARLGRNARNVAEQRFSYARLVDELEKAYANALRIRT